MKTDGLETLLFTTGASVRYKIDEAARLRQKTLREIEQADFPGGASFQFGRLRDIIAEVHGINTGGTNPDEIIQKMGVPVWAVRTISIEHPKDQFKREVLTLMGSVKSPVEADSLQRGVSEKLLSEWERYLVATLPNAHLVKQTREFLRGGREDLSALEGKKGYLPDMCRSILGGRIREALTRSHKFAAYVMTAEGTTNRPVRRGTELIRESVIELAGERK